MCPLFVIYIVILIMPLRLFVTSTIFQSGLLFLYFFNSFINKAIPFCERFIPLFFSFLRIIHAKRRLITRDVGKQHTVFELMDTFIRLLLHEYLYFIPVSTLNFKKISYCAFFDKTKYLDKIYVL